MAGNLKTLIIQHSHAMVAIVSPTATTIPAPVDVVPEVVTVVVTSVVNVSVVVSVPVDVPEAEVSSDDPFPMLIAISKPGKERLRGKIVVTGGASSALLEVEVVSEVTDAALVDVSVTVDVLVDVTVVVELVVLEDSVGVAGTGGVIMKGNPRGSIPIGGVTVVSVVESMVEVEVIVIEDSSVDVVNVVVVIVSVDVRGLAVVLTLAPSGVMGNGKGRSRPSTGIIPAWAVVVVVESVSVVVVVIKCCSLVSV